jgi:hypothetical protein
LRGRVPRGADGSPAEQEHEEDAGYLLSVLRGVLMARPRGGGAHIPLDYQGATSPIVRVQIVYGPTQHYAEVAAYVAYLAKHGKGEDGGAGEHFDRQGPDAEIPAFVARCMRAPWVFKVMVCPPADHSTALPL